MASGNKKKKETRPLSRRDKILSWIIIGVIALEVVLVIVVLGKRALGGQKPQSAEAESTVTQETASQESAETPETTSQEGTVVKPGTEAAEAEPQDVNWHGKDMSAVPSSSGALVLDYGEKDWWVEEGFVGQYTMTQITGEAEGVTESFSEAMIYSNGAIVWVIDDDVYSGELFSKRYFDSAAHGYATTDSDNMPRAFDIDFVKLEDGKAVPFAADEIVDPTYIEIYAAEQEEPDPLREIHVVLERINDGQ